MTTEVSSSPELMSQCLVDHAIEVASKLLPVDPYPRGRQCGDLLAGNERAASRPTGRSSATGLTVACHDEGLAGRHCVDDLRIVVA